MSIELLEPEEKKAEKPKKVLKQKNPQATKEGADAKAVSNNSTTPEPTTEGMRAYVDAFLEAHPREEASSDSLVEGGKAATNKAGEQVPEKALLARHVAAGGKQEEFTPERAEKVKAAIERVPGLTKRLASFLRGTIQQGSKVRLGSSIENSLGEYLEAAAVVQPEILSTYEPALAHLESQPAEVAEKEKKIDEQLRAMPDYSSLTQRRSELSSEKEIAGRTKKSAERGVRAYERLKGRDNAVKRFFGGIKDKLFGKPAKVQYSEREGGEIQGKIQALEEGLEDVEKNIATYEQADALKESLHEGFNEYRRDLFDNFEPAQELAKRASDKARQRLFDLIDENSLDGLQQAQEYLNHLRAQDTGLDFLQDLDPEKAQQEIDYLLAATVNTELDAQIEKAFEMLDFDSTGEGVYDDLAKAAEPYLGLERLGSKNAQRTKKFFANILRKKMEELNKPEDEAKRLLLKKLIAQYGLFENKVVFIRGKKGEGVWQTE